MVLSVSFSSGFIVGFGRFERRIKASEVFVAAIISDLRDIICSIRPMNSRNPLKSGGVVSLSLAVSIVLGVIGFPEVVYRVVMTHQVLMVNLMRGPFAIYVKPSQTVGIMMLAVNPNKDITMGKKRASNKIWPSPRPASSPMENPGYRIVGQKFFETLYSQGQRLSSPLVISEI